MKKDFLEKMKSDQKTQAAVICSIVGAVLVLTAAVTIPVALHNRVKVASETESAMITTEAAVTESASAAVTEPETEAVSELITEPTTAETTAQAASKNADAGKNTPVDKNKGGSANKNGGSDSSAKKPNSGSNGGQAQQKPPVQNEAPVQSNKNQWSQEKIDSLISEMKRYAINNGLIIDNSLTAINTSWSNPIGVGNGKSYDKAKADIKYDIDELLDGNPYHINIFAKITTASDGTDRWEIYVVY